MATTAIFAGATAADIRKSTDLGLTWGGEDSTGANAIYSIDGLTLQDVWFGGDTGLLHHWNGTSYDIKTTAGSATQSGIHMIATDNVWAVGSGGGAGTIYTYNGSTWSAHSEPSGTANNYYAVWALDANNVWIAGSDVIAASEYARVWYWNGATWAAVVSSGTGNTRFHAIYGADTNNIWAGGWTTTTSLLYKWNGSAWSDIRSGLDTPDLAIYGIDGHSSSAVWCCGQEFAVYHGTVQGWDGATWTTEYQESGKRLDALWISEYGDVGIVVGEGGELARWTP